MEVDSPWHVHDMHQLLYAFQGSLEVESDHTGFLIPDQFAAWIPAGAVHRTTIHRVRSGSVFFHPSMVAGAGSRVRVVLVPPLMREMIMGAMRWPISEPVRPMGRTYLRTWRARIWRPSAALLDSRSDRCVGIFARVRG
jgi:hypothetical protein